MNDPSITPEPSDFEVMKLARVLYCADNWGVPDAGDRWDDGKAYDHQYDRFERLARAALGAGVATHNTVEDSNQKVQVDLLAHALHVADGYGDGWTFLSTHRKDAYFVCASRVQTWLLDEAEGLHATGEELIARVRRDVTALASRADHRDVALLVPTSKETP